MKNTVLVIILGCFVVLTLLFYTMWQHDKNSDSLLKEQSQIAAGSALTFFNQYLIGQNEIDYTYGVSEINVLVSASRLMNKESYPFKQRVIINAVYSKLVLSKDKSKENLNLLVGALTMLSGNINNPEAYDNFRQFNDATGG